MIADDLPVVPRPGDFGAWFGLSIGGLFTLASIYSTVLMLRRPRRPGRRTRGGCASVMISLFIAMGGVFIAVMFMNEERLGDGDPQSASRGPLPSTS